MTKEIAIKVIRKMLAYTDLSVRANLTADMIDACHLAIKALEQEYILDKIRTEIEQEIKQEKIARHVFRYEKIDAVKAEQCTGSIHAYHNVIAYIDKLRGKK